MSVPAQELKSIFRLEQRTSLASKLAATVALLLAGIAFSVFTLAILYWPRILAVTRWTSMATLSICYLFVAAALVFLWVPKCPRRLYLVIERCFFVLLVLTLPVLTAALLWQAIAAL